MSIIFTHKRTNFRYSRNLKISKHKKKSCYVIKKNTYNLGKYNFNYKYNLTCN